LVVLILADPRFPLASVAEHSRMYVVDPLVW
jgi:hypothetical protein